MAISQNYLYQVPHLTYTLDQFIACQSNDTFCYNNTSFLDKWENMHYNTYNVCSDYLDELREEYSVRVSLTEEQALKYKYRPKLLCYDVYGNTELAFLIMLINDMCSVKDFTKTILLLPTKASMQNITRYIYNANIQAIEIYNLQNNTDT